MRRIWAKSPRVVSDKMKGKNGGAHVEQRVLLTLVPKGAVYVPVTL
jgi:hypothetical protein